MSSTVTLDSAGRVVIPKPLREELRLQPGDALSLESDGEQMLLKPVRHGSAMRKEHGVWVFRIGKRISAADTDAALQDVRNSRTRQSTKKA